MDFKVNNADDHYRYMLRKQQLKMNFEYLADHKEAIPTISKWYFNQWDHIADVNSVKKKSHRLLKYLNRDEIPLMLLAIGDGEIIGVVQLKYQEMDIYPDKEYWIGGIFIPKK